MDTAPQNPIHVAFPQTRYSTADVSVVQTELDLNYHESEHN